MSYFDPNKKNKIKNDEKATLNGDPGICCSANLIDMS